MADNVTADAGSGGAVFATDDIGGVHYPITKLTFGALDSQTIASSGNGTTDAGTQRVTISSDSTGTVAVTNAGTFAVQVDGAALTALQLIDNIVLAEDAAHVSSDAGVQLLAVRTDTPAARSSTDGDYEPLQVSAGRLWTSAVVTSLPASTNTIEVVGDAAHDAAIAGNPLRIAGRALTSSYTAVATGDTADLITTTIGQLVEIPYSIPENTWSYAAASGGITNTTGVTAKASAGAGLRNYITRVQIINGHATVSTDVQIRDGASGTVLWRGFAQAAGGGVSAVFDPPLRGSAATLVEVACGTTGSATYFNLQGYVAP